MTTVYYAFAIVFLIIIVLAFLTAIAFVWVLIITEAVELENKYRVAKAVKESEAKYEAR